VYSKTVLTRLDPFSVDPFYLIHVHGLQFGVVAREGGEPNHDLRAGLVDEGRHDTVLVLPGERVRIALAFEDFDGLYMYHCHNMEHEDNGMMQYYRVSA